jgi:hypothetical protein
MKMFINVTLIWLKRAESVNLQYINKKQNTARQLLGLKSEKGSQSFLLRRILEKEETSSRRKFFNVVSGYTVQLGFTQVQKYRILTEVRTLA